MHTITIGEQEIQVPGQWNELTSDQLLSMSSIIREKIGIEELKIKMLFAFTGIRVLQCASVMVDEVEHFWIACGKMKVIVPAHSLSYVTNPFLKFFEEREEDEYFVKSTLTKQLIPCLRIGNDKLFGPSDGLANITLREFIFTETEYRNSDNNLISILYRPHGKVKKDSKEYKGDVREPFNDNNYDVRIPLIEKVPETTKRAILWYYEGCKQHLSNLFPKVFKSGSEASSNKSTFESFMVIVDELAHNQPAEHERVLDVLLYSALNSLNQRIEKLPKDGKV